MKKTIPPIRLYEKDWLSLEKEIAEIFKKEIYLPLIEILKKDQSKIENSNDDLIDAIKSGRIYFRRGIFLGKFNSRISKALKSVGAKWDKKQSGFKILLNKLPYEIRVAIQISDNNYYKVITRLGDRISEIVPEDVARKVKSKKIFGSVLSSFDDRFRKSLKGITIVPRLTKDQKEKIAEEYTTNMDKYIKGWVDEEIVKLRKRVKTRAFSGLRYESLAEDIENRYGVSKSKAKFLARQETNLMMSKFRESRYEEAGIKEYKWKCVLGTPAHPVRPWHKRLDGMVFKWNNPPITDEKGNRNHPGEDFNCRCFPLPIVGF